MTLLTETGLISIITLGTAFLSAALGMCYKSKCSSIKFCGVEINRDTQAELKEDMVMLDRAKKPSFEGKYANVINHV